MSNEETSQISDLRGAALAGLDPPASMHNIQDADVLFVIYLLRHKQHVHEARLSSKLSRTQTLLDEHGMEQISGIVERDRDAWRKLIGDYANGEVGEPARAVAGLYVARRFKLTQRSRVIHTNPKPNSNGMVCDRIIEKRDAEERVYYKFVRHDGSGKAVASAMLKTGTVVDKSVVLQHYKEWASEADKNCIAL